MGRACGQALISPNQLLGTQALLDRRNTGGEQRQEPVRRLLHTYCRGKEQHVDTADDMARSTKWQGNRADPTVSAAHCPGISARGIIGKQQGNAFADCPAALGKCAMAQSDLQHFLTARLVRSGGSERQAIAITKALSPLSSRSR